MKVAKICVVTCIPPDNILVKKFVKVLEPSVEQLTLITGNYSKNDLFSSKITLINVEQVHADSLLMRTINLVALQCKFAWLLIKNMSGSSIVVFFLEGGMYLIPMLAAKIGNKKTIIVITQSVVSISKRTDNSKIILLIYKIITSINFSIADKLVVYSQNLRKELNLVNNKKVVIAHEHFIDFNLFKPVIDVEKRENIVGFIGRLSNEKGIINFLEAAELLLSKGNPLIFHVIGDGPLKEAVKEFIAKNGFAEKIIYFDWVDNDKLCQYLNQIKLVVIPSYTEGLVNVLLEAMACGTPVLANTVGAIPDVISDGETGFLLQDNSPKCIADGICKVINGSKLKNIVMKAYSMIKNEYNFENAVSKYNEILNQLIC